MHIIMLLSAPVRTWYTTSICVKSRTHYSCHKCCRYAVRMYLYTMPCQSVFPSVWHTKGHVTQCAPCHSPNSNIAHAQCVPVVARFCAFSEDCRGTLSQGAPTDLPWEQTTFREEGMGVGRRMGDKKRMEMRGSKKCTRRGTEAGEGREGKE